MKVLRHIVDNGSQRRAKEISIRVLIFFMFFEASNQKKGEIF